MGKENNPYLKEIREKVHNVFEALDKTLKEDDNINFETFNVKWSYNDAGCVYLDIERLITWQFKDQIKKANEWEEQQKIKQIQKFAKANDDEIFAKLELQTKLNYVGDLYVAWDRAETYYFQCKPELKIIKKLQKLETVKYHKPAYTSCFGKISAPDAVIVKGFKNGIEVGELTIPLHCIDLEKTFENKKVD